MQACVRCQWQSRLWVTHWGGCWLTRGGQSPRRTPSGGPSLCSPHCGDRPISSAETPGRPVDCREANVERLNSFSPSPRNQQGFFFFEWIEHKGLKQKEGGKTYLQPTNLGAYLWIWLLKSEGLMASLFTEVHRLWVSFANSEIVGEGKRNEDRKWNHNHWNHIPAICEQHS